MKAQQLQTHVLKYKENHLIARINILKMLYK